MAVHPALETLAQEIAARKNDGTPPVTLLLGTGAAREAGIPAIADIARRVLRRGKAPSGSTPTADGAVGAFLDRLASIDGPDRAAVAERMSAGIPVPQFAAEMALLAREGFFRTVISTSFDTLPERALDDAGMVYDRDYGVVDMLDDEPRFGALPLMIVKAYAGLGRTGPVAEALDGACVVAGPGDDDPPLVDALANPGGPLWWISERPVPSAYRQSRTVHVVATDADRLFGELSFLLLQSPSLNIVSSYTNAGKGDILPTSRGDDTMTEIAGGATVSTKLRSMGGTSPPADVGDDDFERELLRMRIKRCRQAVRRLERRGGGTVGDPAIDVQLAYERTRLAELETSLQPAGPTKVGILKVLSDVESSPAVTADARTRDYLHTLVAEITAELQRPRPNGMIVGASLNAVRMVAESAGVDRGVMREISDLSSRGGALL
jgi:hypothetical protein